MIKIIFKILNLIGLLGATAWMVSNFDWEPFVLFVTLLASFIVLIFRKDDNDEINADRKLFEKFNEDLPFFNVDYIESTSLKSTFLINKLDPFFNFQIIWKDVHHTFLNKILEKKKKQLYKSNDEFARLIAEKTFSTHNPRLYRIPEEWEINDKRGYDEVCRNIYDTQTKVVNDYNDFIQTAKKNIKSINKSMYNKQLLMNHRQKALILIRK
jgi:hypothetical protein